MLVVTMKENVPLLLGAVIAELALVHATFDSAAQLLAHVASEDSLGRVPGVADRASWPGACNLFRVVCVVVRVIKLATVQNLVTE